MAEITVPAQDFRATRGGESLFVRVNPFLILVSMGMATALTWFFTGGGYKGNGRMPTTLPEFELGDEIGGQTITGIRTHWQYELDGIDGWVHEESL